MAEKKAHVDVKRQVNEFASRWKSDLDKIRKQKSQAELEDSLRSDLQEQMAKFQEDVLTRQKDQLEDFGKNMRKTAREDHDSNFEYNQVEHDVKAGEAPKTALISKMVDEAPMRFAGREEAVAELQKHNDTVLVLSHMLKRHPTELKYYDTYFRKNSELAKALDNTTAGSGLEWVPTAFSSNFINRMEQNYEVAGTFPSVSIPQGTESLKIPGAGSGISVVTYGTQTGDDLTSTNWINGATPGSRNITLTPVKMGVRVEIEEEAVEDSIVNVVQDITIPEMQVAAAKGVDDAIINGDSSGTHMDNLGGVASPDPRMAYIGLRKQALGGAFSDNSVDGGGDAITIADIKSLLGGFKDGTTNEIFYDPPNMRLLCPLKTYLDLLTITEVLTRDKIGEGQMTIDKGQLTSVLGIPIIRTELIRLASATGTLAGSGNTLGTAVIYHTNAFIVGQKRDVTIKSREEIETDRRKFVLTFRTAFANRYADAKKVAGAIYNIT